MSSTAFFFIPFPSPLISPSIPPPQARPGRPEATRPELRCPDPSCNPYLAFAAMLAAGLDGIERNLELARPVEENLYHFDDTMIRKQGVRTLHLWEGRPADKAVADHLLLI